MSKCLDLVITSISLRKDSGLEIKLILQSHKDMRKLGFVCKLSGRSKTVNHQVSLDKFNVIVELSLKDISTRMVIV